MEETVYVMPEDDEDEETIKVWGGTCPRPGQAFRLRPVDADGAVTDGQETVRDALCSRYVF